MKNIVVLSVFLSCFLGTGQALKVQAEKGDGIFSLLRKHGLAPSKYYAPFVALNEGRLKNGSELQVGWEYLIPDASDSLKKMALNINGEATEGESLFEGELSGLSLKSTLLQDAVLYLLPVHGTEAVSDKTKALERKIMRRAAKELMENGAQVYVLDQGETTNGRAQEPEKEDAEGAIASREGMSFFVERINKHYLRHIGKYQRVLVLNFNKDLEDSEKYTISIYHHGGSGEGEQFAQNLWRIFKAHGRSTSKGRAVRIFENEDNLYLVKNVLPPVTMIDLNEQTPKGNQQLTLSKREDLLIRSITGGVLNDFAQAP